MSEKIRVLAWSEQSEPRNVYPNGISGALAEHLGGQSDMQVRTASIDDAEQGVSDAALAETDVLLWFGHVKHDKVTQESVDRVLRHVKERGMGFLPLHSSHYSKPLRQLTGTSGSWRSYVENGKPARLRVNGRKRFIHEQDLRVDRKHARQGDALAHAAGKFVRITSLESGQADHADEALSGCRHLGPG